MSGGGYRTSHREQLLKDEAPIWQVRALSFSRSTSVWTLLVAAADGIVRIFRVSEKTASNELDASALSLESTHVLLGTNQVYAPPSQSSIGCCQCQVIRNYIGDDDMSGDFVVVALDIIGTMRVWIFQEDHFNQEVLDTPNQMRSLHEFVIMDATGTLMAVCPPNLHGQGDLKVAVACLDGAIAIVALGIATPQAKTKESSPGTILDRLGSGSTPLSLCWHPNDVTIAVGRIDGLVELVHLTHKSHHRLTHHSEPVRAVDFTPDGALLITGCDGGHLAVWDIGGDQKMLVHHVMHAHTTWVLGICAMSDSQRFATTGADGKIHIWTLNTLHSPTRTFHIDQCNWTIALTKNKEPQRLVSGSDKGWLHIFTLDG